MAHNRKQEKQASPELDTSFRNELKFYLIGAGEKGDKRPVWFFLPDGNFVIPPA
jgi:hypothetical protein